MNITAISDTHGYHEQLRLTGGDVLIHAGDISKRGMKVEVDYFLEWFSKQPYEYKIFIAGNHDFYFEYFPEDSLTIIPENVIYLNDNGITVEGIKIWGSPITPWFHDWAFNRHRGKDIDPHWQMIPDDIDILITHGPVAGILDTTIRKHNVGCEDLLKKIKTINPKYHICGHIHEAYGVHDNGSTLFINASIADINYQMVNKPIDFIY